MKKIILFLFLFLNLNVKNLVLSDISSLEVNTLWWLSIQYGLAWDLSSGKICSNIGIVCDSTLNHITELIIDQRIPSGTVIPPIGSTTGSTGSTATTSTTGSTGSTGSTATTSTTSPTTDGSSTYTTSSSSSSTTFQTTMPASITPAKIPNYDPLLSVLEVKYQSLNLKSLMTRLQSTPNNINYLDLPSLTSLKILSRNSISNINVYAYISNLPQLQYLEISDIGNLNDIPTTLIYFCDMLTTLIIKNISASVVPDSLLNNGSPLIKVVLDFEITSFSWGKTNSIENFLINYNNGTTFSIDGFDWQKLKNLTIKTESSFIILNMLLLKQVSVICPNTSPHSYKWQNNNGMDSVEFNHCGIDILGLRFLNTNLTSLTILDSLLASSVPISPYPPNLEILRIERSNFGQLPGKSVLPYIKELIIPENIQYGSIDDYQTLNKINVSTNFFSQAVPEELCLVAEIDLSKNQFSWVPDCFLCHWSLTSNWFSGNSIDLSPNNTFVCDIQLDQTTFNIINIGDTVQLTGKNLGWKNTASTSTLQMIEPNTKFIFSIPPKTQGITSELVKFSNDHSFLLNWTYFTLEVTHVDFIQTSSNILVNISGLFDPTSIIYLNGVEYLNPTISNNQTMVQITLPISYTEGPVDVLLKNSKTSSLFKTVFRRAYPTISSASILSSGDSQITIYGNFYKNSTTGGSGITFAKYRSLLSVDDTFSEITIKIYGSPCTIISFSKNMIIVSGLPTFSQGGYAPLSIENNGYVFTSSKLIFYEKQNSNQQCSEICENGGTCFESKCKCINDYYGPSCSFIKSDVSKYTLTTDETKPSATYALSKVEFEFSLQSIQELDFNNNVVQTKQITTWLYQSDKMIERLGSGSVYVSNMDDGVDITASVFIANESVGYQFAGVTMDLGVSQVKVSMNISNWQYQSSLNTLRAVFKSTSTSNIKQEDQCQTTDAKIKSEINDQYNTLTSFTIIRNGDVLYGSFIDRMLSNGRISYSRVEDLGLDPLNPSTSLVGINMPQCQECLLDPDYSVLVDPGFGDQDGCGKGNSKKWVIPVAIVIPIVAIVALSVIGYVIYKKHFIFAKDGKSFMFYNRKKPKKFNLRKL